MPFRPGQSGNPKGRKRGIANASRLRERIGSRIEAVIDALHEQALAGDVQAARALLDRCVAPLKPQEATVTLSLGDDLGGAARGILAALSSGQLPPGQAAQVMSGVASLARVIVVTELEERIRALEASREAEQPSSEPGGEAGGA